MVLVAVYLPKKMAALAMALATGFLPMEMAALEKALEEALLPEAGLQSLLIPLRKKSHRPQNRLTRLMNQQPLTRAR